MKGYWLHYDDSHLSIYREFGKEIFGKDFTIKSIDVDKIEKLKDVHSLLKTNPKFIVLPLSLPRHISLAIAESVHILNLKIILILISRTEVSKLELLKLFDVHFKAMPMPNIFLDSFKNQLSKRLNGEELKLTIRRVSFAGCFMPIPDRHPELYRDYRQSTLFINENERIDSWGCTHVFHRVFISYSHKDKKWLERLKVHLKPIEREGMIDFWSDTNIEAGEIWKEKIMFSMKRANIFILLISADFLASDFINKVELPHIIESAERGYKKIFPIVLSPCGYEYSSLNKFQSINSPSKALIGLTKIKQEEIFVGVVRAIRSLFKEI